MRHNLIRLRRLQIFIVNLQDVRKGLGELRDGLKRIKEELGGRISDIDSADQYYSQMLDFVAKANSRVEDLVDNVNLAEASFTKVVRYYGEEDRNMTTSEFYAIFKTFVTSYKVRFYCSNSTFSQLIRCFSVRNVKQITNMLWMNARLLKSGNVPPRNCRPRALKRG